MTANQIAAQRLAEAFATIEEFKEYLPSDVYNEFGDAVRDFLGKFEWMAAPAIIRQVFPVVIEAWLEATEVPDETEATAMVEGVSG